MPPDVPFAEFLARIRAGDPGAAAELVLRVEPLLRREVRMRLTDPAVYRLIDSGDICQAVFLSFFVRAAAGQYDLEGPEDLLRLLTRMARNKLVSQVRHVRSRPADARREPAGAVEDLAEIVHGPDPGAVAAGRDLMRAVFDRMTDDERRIAELRAQGYTWPQIAEVLGGTAEARRKQHARALDRVTGELGVDDLA